MIFSSADLKNSIPAMQDELISIRRKLHQHPELGTMEHETDKLILSYLKAWDIPFVFPVADTGIVAMVEGKAKSAAPSYVVGVRADIDALPLQEDKSRPYCSLNDGVMHACGHDAHTTIALGVAHYLKMHENEWSGCVKFFFQPAEETCGGAERMVEAGCMEHPHVDYVIGLHMMPTHPYGVVELKYDDLNASSDELILRLHGKASHCAYPENGVDGIVMAAAVIQSLQSIVSRNLSPFQNTVISFGTINGGTAPNILAETVELQGTLRTTNPQTRAYALARIKTLAEEICSAYGGHAELIVNAGYDALINTNHIVDLVQAVAAERLGADHVVRKPYPSLGVEDFSFFLNKASGAFYHLGCANAEKGITAPLHNPQFDIDERVLALGVELQCALIGKLLAGEGEKK